MKANTDEAPAVDYRMPAEWAPQDRIWMAFPCTGYSLGDDRGGPARGAVHLGGGRARGRRIRARHGRRASAGTRHRRPVPSQSIDIIEAPLNDAWMRDIGPTFVHAADGSVAAVDWVFNGWGAQDWAQWDLDASIARVVAEAAGVPIISSDLVNEGGGIHVDGEGTVLVTDTVQLDPGRNPGLTPGGGGGGVGPHHRSHPRSLAAAGAHPRLRTVRHPRARRHRRRDHLTGPAAAAHPGRSVPSRLRGVPGPSGPRSMPPTTRRGAPGRSPRCLLRPR